MNYLLVLLILTATSWTAFNQAIDCGNHDLDDMISGQVAVVDHENGSDLRARSHEHENAELNCEVCFFHYALLANSRRGSLHTSAAKLQPMIRSGFFRYQNPYIANWLRPPITV